MIKRRGITIEFAFDPEHDQVSSPEAQASMRKTAKEIGRRLGNAMEAAMVDAIFGPKVALDHSIARHVTWSEMGAFNDATASEPQGIRPPSSAP